LGAVTVASAREPSPSAAFVNFYCASKSAFAAAGLEEPMRPLLKDVEGLGRQGDSAIAIDLNGDAKNEFLVPFDCSAVGNCLCAVIDSSKRVIGQLNGKVFAIEPLRDRWSTIFAYHHMSAGSGAVTVYEFKSNRYEEVESGDEIEGKPVARFLRCEKNPKCCPSSLRLSRVLEGAYRQIGVTKLYDGGYHKIAFPGGDVPMERGVCTDVIVRAYRHAGVDLQVLVNEDMKRDFASYPQLWGLSAPDPNIDHRRVPNLAAYFARNGARLDVTSSAVDYRPGDIVTWRLTSGVPHIGLVSDRSKDGRPLMIHNIGAGAQVEDMLFAYEITGHYRYDP